MVTWLLLTLNPDTEHCARYRAELYDLTNDPEESHNIAEDEVNIISLRWLLLRKSRYNFNLLTVGSYVVIFIKKLLNNPICSSFC